jgi:MFS transporter, putative metabolite:H+ symporter
MSTQAELAARLDRLPMTKHIWYLVTLISLGGCFELYDLFLTAYIAPALNRAGYFTAESLGPFNVLGPHVAGIGTFVFALFAGLFIGAIFLGHVADNYGRRTVFTFSLVWYSITTAIMAFQTSGFGVDLWRFIAGIGIGVELVTIDTYVAELVPATHRGRAFAFNQFLQFLAVPIMAFIAYLLVPHAPLGFDGWRWVVLIGSAGAIVIWFIRLGLPESPRWLARHNRIADAERVTASIEAGVARDIGEPLPPPGPLVAQETGEGSFAEIWQPPYARRAIILSVFNFFQTFGYYGFAAWVPTLLIAKGITITHSLLYAFIIAIANPVGPLLGTLIADKMERKWQVCGGAIGIGVFGMLFANAADAGLLIVLGVLVTLCNNWMSFSFHNYQSEQFPTRIRSRAVGFVYSWSRLSAALSGLIVAYLLNHGVTAVFGFIAFSMLIVVVSIGGFGPRTKGLALEAISHA